MFWTRVASGIVLLIILGTVFVMGGPVLAVFFGIVSLIGMHEFYKAVGLVSDEKKNNSLTSVGYLACICLYLIEIINAGSIEYMVLPVIAMVIISLAVFVLSYPKYNIKDIVFANFAFSYVALMLCFVYNTRSLSNGKYLVWLIFMSSWICDIFAYCVGMLFGKHKLAPVLSPKKSIEGAVGGVFFSALFGGVYGYFVRDYIVTNISVVILCAVVCAVGACVSQIGDLSASAIKRNYDIKDYGHLIPGHGGILDRFDSVIFTAPMVYIVSILLG